MQPLLGSTVTYILICIINIVQENMAEEGPIYYIIYFPFFPVGEGICLIFNVLINTLLGTLWVEGAQNDYF